MSKSTKNRARARKAQAKKNAASSSDSAGSTTDTKKTASTTTPKTVTSRSAAATSIGATMTSTTTSKKQSASTSKTVPATKAKATPTTKTAPKAKATPATKTAPEAKATPATKTARKSPPNAKATPKTAKKTSAAEPDTKETSRKPTPPTATPPRGSSTRRAESPDLDVPRKRRKTRTTAARGATAEVAEGDTLVETRPSSDEDTATGTLTQPAVDDAPDQLDTDTTPATHDRLEQAAPVEDDGVADDEAQGDETEATTKTPDTSTESTDDTPADVRTPSKASAGAEQVDIRPSTTRVNRPVTAEAHRSEPLVLPALIQLALGVTCLAAIAGFAADVVLASDISLLGNFGLLERVQTIADAVSFVILPLTAVTGVLSLILMVPWLRGLRSDDHDWVEPAVPGIVTWAAATAGAYFVQRRVLGGDGASSWMNDDLIMSSLFFHGILLIGAVIGALAVGQIKDAYLDRRRFVTPGQKI